jgi:hypothetical protein
MDWHYLLRAAYRHGLMPLLYWNLSSACPTIVPEAILSELRDYCQNNSRRNLFFTGELLKLLNVFEMHGIRAIPYKGPVLANSAYGNIGLREFCDLDILVRSQDALRARTLLGSLGYQSRLHLTGAQEAAFIHNRCEYTLSHSEDDLLVEIQWNIVPRYFSIPLDFDRLWKRLERVSIGGKEVVSLSAEDLLWILCVHGSKHLWNRLEWICGVAELIRTSEPLDWKRVIDDAKELGAEKMLRLGLYLANDLLGAVLPREILQSVRGDPMVKSLAAQVVEGLFREAQDSPGTYKSILFHLRAREHWKDRMRYCFRFAVTPNVEDWESVSLPRYLFFLYYPLRAIRLAGKYRPRVLKRIQTLLL